MMQGHLSRVAVVVLASVLAGGTGASAGDAGFPAFEGLWQAIDSFDGSTQRLSITCSRQGACDARLNDTAFTLSCPDQIGFAQGWERSNATC